MPPRVLDMSRLVRACALMLALLLSLGAVPAHADGGLLEDLFGTDPKPATGQVASPDGVLEKGCQRHRYRYRLNIPAGDSWALETWLVDRRGRTVSSGYQIKGADPKKGKGVFRFCSQNVKPGRYKVRARLVWSDYSDQHVKWLRPDRLRLRRG